MNPEIEQIVVSTKRVWTLILWRLGYIRPRSGGEYARLSARARLQHTNAAIRRREYGRLLIYWAWWISTCVPCALATAYRGHAKRPSRRELVLPV